MARAEEWAWGCGGLRAFWKEAIRTSHRIVRSLRLLHHMMDTWGQVQSHTERRTFSLRDFRGCRMDSAMFSPSLSTTMVLDRGRVVNAI